MTATAEVHAEIPLPTFTCAKCATTLPHAKECRVCKRSFMGGYPFCLVCRTFTAPLDKEYVKLPDGSFVRKSCPSCGHVPDAETLQRIGQGMTLWAQGVVRGIKPESMEMESPTTKMTGLPIRIVQAQVKGALPGNSRIIKCSEVVEYDLLMQNFQGTEKVIVTQRVQGDTPMGEFLKGVVAEYEAKCAALREAEARIAKRAEKR
jgi:hypothetical protein